LYLVSPADLTPLADALAARGLFLMFVQSGDDRSWYASFETREDFDEPLAGVVAAGDVR